MHLFHIVQFIPCRASTVIDNDTCSSNKDIIYQSLAETGGVISFQREKRKNVKKRKKKKRKDEKSVMKKKRMEYSSRAIEP